MRNSTSDTTHLHVSAMQRLLLEQLAGGGSLVSDRLFYKGTITWPGVTTIRGLEKRGLIESRGGLYDLTTPGRQTLAEAPGCLDCGLPWGRKR